MTFYSVHRTTDGGSSAGYEWFTSERAAKKAAAQWRVGTPEESATVNRWKIKPTKRGILRALNIHASHPDNG
jgi:hypothetical protein